MTTGEPWGVLREALGGPGEGGGASSFYSKFFLSFCTFAPYGGTPLGKQKTAKKVHRPKGVPQQLPRDRRDESAKKNKLRKKKNTFFGSQRTRRVDQHFATKVVQSSILSLKL